MKNYILLLGVLLLSSCSINSKLLDINQKAEAKLMNREGKNVGVVRFLQKEEFVKINVRIDDLEPGEYSMHIHEYPNCTTPDFKTSGDHFNPYNTRHGFLNKKGPHAGDLPNILIKQDGTASINFQTNRITLSEGKKNSLFRGKGTAVVMHESADDYFTDPAGMGGARIACGVIKRIVENNPTVNKK